MSQAVMDTQQGVAEHADVLALCKDLERWLRENNAWNTSITRLHDVHSKTLCRIETILVRAGRANRPLGRDTIVSFAAALNALIVWILAPARIEHYATFKNSSVNLQSLGAIGDDAMRVMRAAALTLDGADGDAFFAQITVPRILAFIAYGDSCGIGDNDQPRFSHSYASSCDLGLLLMRRLPDAFDVECAGAASIRSIAFEDTRYALHRLNGKTSHVYTNAKFSLAATAAYCSNVSRLGVHAFLDEIAYYREGVLSQPADTLDADAFRRVFRVAPSHCSWDEPARQLLDAISLLQRSAKSTLAARDEDSSAGKRVHVGIAST